MPKSGSRLKESWCKIKKETPKNWEIGSCGFARETITRHQNRKRNMKCFGNVAKFFRHVWLFLVCRGFLLSDKYILSPFLFSTTIIYSSLLFYYIFFFSRKQFTQFPGIETNEMRGGKKGKMGRDGSAARPTDTTIRLAIKMTCCSFFVHFLHRSWMEQV